MKVERDYTAKNLKQVYHIKAVKCFLKAGVWWSKMEPFRSILEENAIYWLTRGLALHSVQQINKALQSLFPHLFTSFLDLQV